MLEWYLVSDRRFLLWISDGTRCLGYAGGIISDGSQVHGSASGTIQFAFKEIVMALLKRPWLWFHVELRSRYRLIAKNVYYKITGYKTPVKYRNYHNQIAPYVGLVVIGVHPAHQGEGYGSMLLKRFEEKVIELGHSKMSLTVMANNAQAMKSYHRNGWTTVRQNGRSVQMVKGVHR